MNTRASVRSFNLIKHVVPLFIDASFEFQVINKVGDAPFTQQDELIFASYLQFCGIGLRNAHLYETSQLEVKRNQVLLDLARMIFEEQSTIEHVVFRILTHTQSLIQCQRVQVRFQQISFPKLFRDKLIDVVEV